MGILRPALTPGPLAPQAYGPERRWRACLRCRRISTIPTAGPVLNMQSWRTDLPEIRTLHNKESIYAEITYLFLLRCAVALLRCAVACQRSPVSGAAGAD